MDSTHVRVPVAELSFSGTDGIRWIVREFAGRGAGNNGDGACLIFESDSAVRRVKVFPSNWIDLEPAALERLSWTP